MVYMSNLWLPVAFSALVANFALSGFSRAQNILFAFDAESVVHCLGWVAVYPMLDGLREGIQNRRRSDATVAMKEIWVVTLWCIAISIAIFYIGMWLCAKTHPDSHENALQLLGKLKCWVILGYELMHFEI